MPYYIKHRPSDTYLGPFREKPPDNWSLDIETARPFGSPVSAQAVIVQMAHAFAGDRPNPRDDKYASWPDDGPALRALRRAAYKDAEKEWKTRRDAWVNQLAVVNTDIASDPAIYAKKGITPEQAVEIKAKIKLDKTPNIMTQLGQRKLDLGDD